MYDQRFKPGSCSSILNDSLLQSSLGNERTNFTTISIVTMDTQILFIGKISKLYNKTDGRHSNKNVDVLCRTVIVRIAKSSITKGFNRYE